MAWIRQMFSAQAVGRRIIVRRKKGSVHKYASYDLLERHCKENEFHLVETGDQYIVICNDGHFRLRF
jgi:hypothetical protein